MTKDEALKMAIKTAKTAIKEWQKLVDDLDGKAWRKINELEEKLEDCKEALEQPLTRGWKETIDERIAKDNEFKRALEQPEQEPVAWMLEYRDDEFDYWHKICDESKLGLEMWFDAIRNHMTEYKIYPLYTHPAPSWQGNKEFVGLSDDEIETIMIGKNGTYFNYARAIEQALKDKNT